MFFSFLFDDPIHIYVCGLRLVHDMLRFAQELEECRKISFAKYVIPLLMLFFLFKK